MSRDVYRVSPSVAFAAVQIGRVLYPEITNPGWVVAAAEEVVRRWEAASNPVDETIDQFEFQRFIDDYTFEVEGILGDLSGIAKINRWHDHLSAVAPWPPNGAG